MRLQKIEVNRKTRAAAILLVGLLLIGALANCIAAYRRPDYVVRPRAVYGYNQEGRLTYTVKLIENSVFPTSVLGPGKTYFTKLVQSVPVVCSYRFSGDKPASLKATYRVVAVVDAPKMWSKELVLIPPTEIRTTGKALSFVRTIDLNLAFFNDFLKSINQELGVSAREPKLLLKAEVVTDAVSPQGSVKEHAQPTMIIPLTSGDFQITGAMLDKKLGAIKVKERVLDAKAPIAKRNSLILLVLAALVFMATIIITSSRRELADETTRTINRIIKDFGDRMVKRSDTFFLPEGAGNIILGSIKDLGTVADETSKPIIYGINSEGAYIFCVIDGPMVYTYKLASNGTSPVSH